MIPEDFRPRYSNLSINPVSSVEFNRTIPLLVLRMAVSPRVLSIEERAQWSICGRFDAPPVTHTLAKNPVQPDTVCLLLAGTGKSPEGETYFLVYEVVVVGVGMKYKAKLRVKYLEDGVVQEVAPKNLLPKGVETTAPLAMPAPGFGEIGTEWEGGVSPSDSERDDEQQTPTQVAKSKKPKAKQSNQKKKKRPRVDSYGEALKLGQKADNHDLGPADVAHLTKSELICVLAALNRPAANKSAAVQVLQGQLLAALKEGARLAPLFPKPATKLCVKDSEALSLSPPSLLLVLAARKCSATNHVTLMLAFTSLSLPLQDDESSSEEEADAESPAESPVSCCAPCSRSAVGAKETVSKKKLASVPLWLEWTQVSLLESLLRPQGSRLGWKLVGDNSYKLCG